MEIHPGVTIRDTETDCHACDQPATHQWQREATADEAGQYHANMDAWRASEGLEPMPDTAAIRTAPVMLPVFGCDKHAADATV